MSRAHRGLARSDTLVLMPSLGAAILVTPGPAAGLTKEIAMGKLRDRMIEDLQLRDYARKTCKAYVDCARAFVAYHRRPPEQMGELEVRQFLMHLVETKKVGAATRKMHVAGIKFLYEVTLRRPEVVAAIPWPKVTHGVPEILSGSEVCSLLDAVEAVKHRAVIMTAYGAGFASARSARCRSTTSTASA
jgi:site-specific recombinase XerD